MELNHATQVLRSEECLSSDNRSKPITEIWALAEGVSLPPHVEAFRSNQVRLRPLGKVEANRGVKDYKTAVQKLIQELRAKPSAVGVIFGYFLESPGPVLQRRLREVLTILEQSGLPRDRYLVRPVPWNDEASTIPPDSEPQYPSVFLIEVATKNRTKKTVTDRTNTSAAGELGFFIRQGTWQQRRRWHRSAS